LERKFPLEKHIPEPNQADLIGLYRQLVDIARRQTECLTNRNDVDAIDTFNRLSDEWKEVVVKIEELRQSDSFMGSDNTKIQDELILLSEYQTIIEKLLQERYNELTDSMRGVKNHRTVLHAYGSIATKNKVSLYFDKKK
jgi:hypothetical protein